MRCSFCDVSSEGARRILQTRGSSICIDCIRLVKEVFDEFGVGEALEGKVDVLFVTRNMAKRG